MARYRSAGFGRIRRRLRGRNGRLAGSAVAAGVVLAVIAGHVHAPAGGRASVSGAPMAAAAGGILDCSQLEALWESAGGSASAAFTAAEIAEAESSGQQYATNDNSNGTVDRGYWQINSSHGPLSTFDAHGNARAAVLISSDGTDWTPWTTYNTGAYAGKC
jgi:Lysozyme like domain